MKFSSFAKYFALTQLGSHAFLVRCQLLQQTLLCDLPPAASIRTGTWTAARPSPTLAISETEKLPDNIENHSKTGRMPLIYHPDWICWYRWGDHDNWTQWLWFVGVPERIALSTILLYSSISIATPIVILALSNLFHCRNRLWFCDQPGVVSPWLTVPINCHRCWCPVLQWRPWGTWGCRNHRGPNLMRSTLWFAGSQSFRKTRTIHYHSCRGSFDHGLWKN